MKLLFCRKCTDVRKLHRAGVTCWCGESWGRYLNDNDHAEHSGPSLVVALGNRSFHQAVRDTDKNPMGDQNTTLGFWFKAWVIPFISGKVKRVPEARS